MSTSVCRGCGKEIVWAETNHGKKIPLDPKALVFSVLPQGSGLIAVKPSGGPIGERFMVSHWATCPNANDFHKPKPAAPPADRHFSEPQESAMPSGL